MPKKMRQKKLTTEDQRNLDIEISFFEGVTRRDPSYFEALQILGDNYTRRGKFSDGLKVDEQLARLKPNEATVFYNLACSYTLSSQVDRAFAALERALALGYSDFKWLSRDPDLAKLRKHARYKTLRAKIRALQIKAVAG